MLHLAMGHETPAPFLRPRTHRAVRGATCRRVPEVRYGETTGSLRSGPREYPGRNLLSLPAALDLYGVNEQPNVCFLLSLLESLFVRVCPWRAPMLSGSARTRWSRACKA